MAECDLDGLEGARPYRSGRIELSFDARGRAVADIGSHFSQLICARRGRRLSYDIQMLRLSGPDDPLTQVHRLRDAAILRDQQGQELTSSPDELEARDKLVADLVALNGSLYVMPFDRGWSRGCVVDSDDWDCPIPPIDIHVDSAFVSFSYSADFAAVLPELKRVIEVFERHGYTAYDRQIDAIITSSTSFEESGFSFAATRDGAIAQMHARGETVIGYPARRRWTVAGFITLVGAVTFMLIILVGAVAFILSQQLFTRQMPPSVAKELQELEQRLKRTGSPLGPASEDEAGKNRARGSP